MNPKLEIKVLKKTLVNRISERFITQIGLDVLEEMTVETATDAISRNLLT